MKKQPEVTERTKQKIIDAFWKLSIKEGTKDITVGNVAKTASINRSTFYSYFNDINDLLEVSENQLIESIKNEIETLGELGFPDTLDEYSKITAKIFKTNNEKILFLIGEKGDPGFVYRLEQTLRPILFRLFDISENLPDKDYISSYIISAIIGLWNYWNEHGKQMGAEQLESLAQRLVLYGLNDFLERNPFEGNI